MVLDYPVLYNRSDNFYVGRAGVGIVLVSWLQEENVPPVH